MHRTIYRPARLEDIPEMARLRTAEDPAYGSGEDRLRERMTGYFNGTHHPHLARANRIIYVAWQGTAILGYVAGHLTRRFGCDGELEWVYVAPQQRGLVVASRLLKLLARWFLTQEARRICVDVQPGNVRARKFYARHGAAEFKTSWMLWETIEVVLRPRKTA